MVARNHSLTSLRRRAGLILTVEAMATAALPASLILLAYPTAALFGLGNGWALTADLILALAALGYGLRKFSRPAPAAIDRRIETASRLPHRPLAVLDDVPASTNPDAAQIWAAHQARAKSAMGQARTGFPAFQTAARDPLALRGFLVLLLVTGLVIAGPAAPSRLAGALALPAWPFAGPTATAWITPPAYAAATPSVLIPGEKITALTGSTLTIIVNGGRHTPAIRLGTASLTSAALGDQAYRTDTIVKMSGKLRIGPWWHRIATWNLTIVPPTAPVITLQEAAITSPTSLHLRWSVQDSYGLASLTAGLAPAGYKDALKLIVPLNPAGRAQTLDLRDSPYAGLALNLALIGTNTAKIAASTIAAQQIVLPGPELNDKTAIMLAALRQRIALTPSVESWAGADLGLIAARPPSAITGGADVQIAALSAAMVQHQIGPQDAVDRLTALIREIEAGPDFLPEKKLAQANAALLQALKAGLNGQQVNPAALQSLLHAMQQALAQHLSAIQPASGPAPTGPMFDTSALNRLAQQIAKDEAAGRTAQAAAELRQLQEALSALQSAQPMTAAQATAAAAANQAASALSQLANGEAALLNETHQGGATQGEQTLLQSGLQATQKGLAKAGISLSGLGPAGNSMQAAQNALGQADMPGAETAEGAAIRFLQQAQAALAAQSQNSLAVGQGSSSTTQEGSNGVPDLQPDPGLGMPAPNPAASIQQEIMNEDSNPALPAPAHQYLRRLLTPDQ
jgi:hypothetical protein